LEFTPNTEEKPRGENFVKGRVCVKGEKDIIGIIK
jgi:hypothetical protein